MKTNRAQGYLGLLNKKRQSEQLDAKIQTLITKGKLPQPIRK